MVKTNIKLAPSFYLSFFYSSTLRVQVVVSELTHQLTSPYAYKLTHTSVQARPTPTRRDCTWLRDIRSHLGFARDGHVTLTIMAYPRVRLHRTCKFITGKKPCEARCRSRGSNTRPAAGTTGEQPTERIS